MIRISKREQWLLWFLSGVSLLVIVFYNGFPVLNYDSGAYLYNAYTSEIPFDRPITYSWFIRLVSLQKNLFLVVGVQSFLMSFFIIRILRLFAITFRQSLLVIAGLTLLTQLPFYVAYLSPDLFTPLIFMAGVLLLLSENKIDRILSIPVVFLSIMMHNANLVTSIVTIVVLALLNLFLKKIPKRRLLLLGATITASLLGMSLVHILYEGRFTPSGGSSIFLMAKFGERDVLKTYLMDHCRTEDNSLCNHINDLPQPVEHFIFHPNGLLHKLGGPIRSRLILDSITKHILSTPKYRNLYIRNCLADFKRQIVMTNVYEDVASYLDDTNPFWKVSQLYKPQLQTYIQSKQSQSKLSVSGFNHWFKLQFLFSLILLITMMILCKNNTLRMIALMTILFIVSNALVCSSFTVVFSRLNSRVVWLVFFMALLISFDWFNTRFHQLGGKQKRQPPGLP